MRRRGEIWRFGASMMTVSCSGSVAGVDFFVLAAITHIRIMDPQEFYFSLPFLRTIALFLLYTLSSPVMKYS